MLRIRSVKPLEKFRVRLEFTDGRQKTIDLEPYLQGPIFEQLRDDPALFRTLRVDEELGTIVWKNGADIDPDVLIRDKIPAWMEEQHIAKSSRAFAQQLTMKESMATYRVRKRKK